MGCSYLATAKDLLSEVDDVKFDGASMAMDAMLDAATDVDPNMLKALKHNARRMRKQCKHAHAANRRALGQLEAMEETMGCKDPPLTARPTRQATPRKSPRLAPLTPRQSPRQSPHKTPRSPYLSRANRSPRSARVRHVLLQSPIRKTPRARVPRSPPPSGRYVRARHLKIR